jgi:hypothetical protein
MERDRDRWREIEIERVHTRTRTRTRTQTRTHTHTHTHTLYYIVRRTPVEKFEEERSALAQHSNVEVLPPRAHELGLLCLHAIKCLLIVFGLGDRPTNLVSSAFGARVCHNNGKKKPKIDTFHHLCSPHSPSLLATLPPSHTLLSTHIMCAELTFQVS